MRYLSGLIGLSIVCLATPVAAQPQDDPAPTQASEDDAPPAPPSGASPNLHLPPRGSDGEFETPNRHLTSAEAIWHLRAALNVAALQCQFEPT